MEYYYDHNLTIYTIHRVQEIHRDSSGVFITINVYYIIKDS